jgi:shikimate 5-dehydrogenase
MPNTLNSWQKQQQHQTQQSSLTLGAGGNVEAVAISCKDALRYF